MFVQAGKVQVLQIFTSGEDHHGLIKNMLMEIIMMDFKNTWFTKTKKNLKRQSMMLL